MTTKLPPGAPKLTWKSEADGGDESESGPGDTLSDSEFTGVDNQPPEEKTKANLKKIATRKGK